MKPITFLTIAFGLFLAIFLVSWYFETINTHAFAWGTTIFFAFAACVIALQIMNLRNNEKNSENKGFEYCWRRTNEILNLMDNSDHLEWRGGFDRKSILKAFTIGSKIKHYRTMYSRLVRQKIEVVVIYCVEDDDIVSFVANPSPQKISDPFHDFKPIHQEQRMVMMGGRRGRRGYGVMSMPSLGGGDNGSTGPDEDVVERAFNNR